MRRPDFKPEQETISRQVISGKRCVECLRPFNCGQRKYHLADRNPGLVCLNCYLTAKIQAASTA